MVLYNKKAPKDGAQFAEKLHSHAEGKQNFYTRLKMTSPLLPTHSAPTPPGEMPLEEFLNPMGITQRQLADAIHVPYQRVNEIINGRRGVTPATALRLAKYFNLSADYWMNLQQRWDLYHAKNAEDHLLKSITPLSPKVANMAGNAQSSH